MKTYSSYQSIGLDYTAENIDNDSEEAKTDKLNQELRAHIEEKEDKLRNEMKQDTNQQVSAAVDRLKTDISRSEGGAQPWP